MSCNFKSFVVFFRFLTCLLISRSVGVDLIRFKMAWESSCLWNLTSVLTCEISTRVPEIVDWLFVWSIVFLANPESRCNSCVLIPVFCDCVLKKKGSMLLLLYFCWSLETVSFSSFKVLASFRINYSYIGKC